jgi:hypothetical protein
MMLNVVSAARRTLLATDRFRFNECTAYDAFSS